MTRMLGIYALSIAGSDPRRCIMSTDLPKSRHATQWMLNLTSGGDLRGLRRNWKRVYRDADREMYVTHGRYGRLYLPSDIIDLLEEVATRQQATKRLEELRTTLHAENISYGELAELQGLAEHIDPGDVELLEAAGVPEHPEEHPEEPAEPLKFRITRSWPDMPGFAQWYVYGNRPDWSGDPCWGHFLTHAEAVNFARAILAEEHQEEKRNQA